MPGRFIGWGYANPECTREVEPLVVPPTPSTLQLAICQSVHRVEWFNEKGDRRNGARDNACTDCLRLAVMLGDHLIDVLTSTEGYAALEAGPAAVVALVMGRES